MPQWGKDTVVKFLGGELVFRLSGDKSQEEYVRDLEGMIARGQNMTPAMKAIGLYLMRSTARNFAAQGRPSRWTALKQATVADRIRKGFGAGPILQRKGTLMQSLTKPGARGSILRAGPKSLQYGSSLRYFRVHQLGGKNMPRRVMVILQRQDRAQVGRIINRWIRTGEA